MARHTGGFIVLQRKLESSWIASDGKALAIFVKLLLWANHKRGHKALRGELRMLERGQVVTSPAELGTSLDLPRKLVERRLEMLEESGTIVQQVSNRGRIITILNYDKYQLSGNDGVQQTGSRREADGAADRPADGAADRPPSEEEREQKRVITPLTPRGARRLAVQIVSKAEGAIRRQYDGEQARAFVGEVGWHALCVRFGDWTRFASYYCSAHAAPGAIATVVEAKLQESLQATLLDPSFAPAPHELHA